MLLPVHSCKMLFTLSLLVLSSDFDSVVVDKSEVKVDMESVELSFAEMHVLPVMFNLDCFEVGSLISAFFEIGIETVLLGSQDLQGR